MACLGLDPTSSSRVAFFRWLTTAVATGMVLSCDPKVGSVAPNEEGPTQMTCQPTGENCGCKPCPDLDPDNDSVIAAADACPDVPEDIDGFEDGDGCPDPDNDGDGILDAVRLTAREDGSSVWENSDRRVIGSLEIDCRDRPEDVDGVEDGDGCPEVLVIENCQLLPSGKVVFDYDKATIRPKSYPVLDEIVAAMQATPELIVRVENHKDASGSDAYGRRPTQDRAYAVRDYLIAKGVSSKRLLAQGFGESKPISTNKTPEGRLANRRTEFWVMDCP